MDSAVMAEWDTLQEVVVHRPGIEMFFGLMEPSSFLYERAFSMDEAVHEHRELEHALEETGAKVHRLKHLAVTLARRNPGLLDVARRYAAGIVRYRGPKADVERARASFRKSLGDLDAETVFNILVLRPSVTLDHAGRSGTVFPRVTLDVPLANLLFMRDQQAVSDVGVVVGRMSKPQRRMEPVITGAILEMAGAKVAHRVRAPGTFEGGDFIPAGGFAMVGLGDRTNRAGVDQVLRSGVGFDEVAVVHQPAHPLIPGDDPDPMVDMHLDTYLNLAGEGVAVGCVPLLRRAKVEVYRRTAGGYARRSGNPHLLEYLEGKGFKVVPIATVEQMCYASNFLCVRDRKILAVDVEEVSGKVVKNLEAEARANPHRYMALLAEAKRELAQLREAGRFFPHKKELHDLGVEATPLRLQEITGGYGGAHCMTCVVRRG